MFMQFDFVVLQTRYIKAAMDSISTFRPDGKTPAQAQTIIDNAFTQRADVVAMSSALDTAMAALHLALQTGHAEAIRAYPVMKSRYRKVADKLEVILKIPTGDQSDNEIFNRVQVTAQTWLGLPNDPFTSAPFALPDLTQTQFQALFADLQTKRAGIVTAQEQIDFSLAKLHQMEDAMGDFVTAALAEGRADYADGTPERALIDRVPIAPATQQPSQATISVATSPGTGQAHLEYDAPHATQWNVLHKAPGDSDFTIVAQGVIEKVYDASGLAAGNHDYKVIGHNSQGDGLASTMSTVAVG